VPQRSYGPDNDGVVVGTILFSSEQRCNEEAECAASGAGRRSTLSALLLRHELTDAGSTPRPRRGDAGEGHSRVGYSQALPCIC